MAGHFMHGNLYRFGSPQPSYWEATGGDESVRAPALAGDESCDVAIIGGGFTGLSAALHLARDHGVDVRVLEAGHIGWGASGRNGGFCCPGGSKLSGAQLIRRFGAAQARELYQSMVAAVDVVKTVLADEAIDADACGEAEAEVAHDAAAAARQAAECELLREALGARVRYLSADEFRERYYDSPEAFGARLNEPAFGLHPLRYCRGLAAAAARRGAALHSDSRVLEWGRRDGRHRLVTAGGTLRARRVIYACNGFMEEGLNPAFDGRWLPIISAIIVTRPLAATELAGHRWQNRETFSTARDVLNYFRVLPDGRFLFGGRGTSLGDPDGERTAYRDLSRTLARLFPAWADVDIEYRWHGLICFTARLVPTLGQLPDDPSAWFAYGYHGNGVSEATWSGKQLADWIGKGQPPAGLPAAVKGLAPRFPLPGLRKHYFQLALALAKWRDERSVRTALRS